MARSFYVAFPRFVAGLAVLPFAAALASACGGSDVIDAPDSSTLPDGSLFDARGPEAAVFDTGTHDADAGTDTGTSADTGALPDTGSRDADAAVLLDSAIPDADAALLDAAPLDAAVQDAGRFDSGDSGTASLMQSLGRAEPFVVLAAATVTNSGTSTVLIGDVGTTGPSITGLTGPPFQPSGSTETNNMRATNALLDLGTAYTTLAGRACPPANNLTGQDLGGKTLAPGVYCFSSSAGQISATTLTFDAQGDPNAVWIIQVATSLTVMDNATAVIINGPASMACRIFWAAGMGITINGGAHYLGNAIASSATTMLTNATLSPGRAFGVTAGVTLLSNTISAALCP